MTTEPYLVIDWVGATEDDKAKALVTINAAFAALGMTAPLGAQATFAREGERMPEVTSEQHAAADIWDDMEKIALSALGTDPAIDRLPNFTGQIDPWTSEALQQIAEAKKAA